MIGGGGGGRTRIGGGGGGRTRIAWPNGEGDVPPLARNSISQSEWEAKKRSINNLHL